MFIKVSAWHFYPSPFCPFFIPVGNKQTNNQRTLFVFYLSLHRFIINNKDHHWSETYYTHLAVHTIKSLYLSPVNLVYIFQCSSPPHHPVYVSRVHPSLLVLSLCLCLCVFFTSHRIFYSSYFRETQNCLLLLSWNNGERDFGSRKESYSCRNNTVVH